MSEGCERTSVISYISESASFVNKCNDVRRTCLRFMSTTRNSKQCKRQQIHNEFKYIYICIGCCWLYGGGLLASTANSFPLIVPNQSFSSILLPFAVFGFDRWIECRLTIVKMLYRKSQATPSTTAHNLRTALDKIVCV